MHDKKHTDDLHKKALDHIINKHSATPDDPRYWDEEPLYHKNNPAKKKKPCCEEEETCEKDKCNGKCNCSH